MLRIGRREVVVSSIFGETGTLQRTKEASV